VGIPASLTPENHAGMLNCGMPDCLLPGIHWTLKNCYLGILAN